MVGAVALLAALTGASNHAPIGGEGSGQALAVGLTSTHEGTPPSAKSKARTGAGTSPTTVGAAGRPTTTAVTSEPTTTVAAASTADETPAAEAESEADADPVPTRTRETPPATDPPAPPAAAVVVGLTRLPNVELEVLTLTNMDRGNNGVPPITRDSCMDSEASAWAHAMADSEVMAHSADGGAAVQGCRGSSASWGDNIGYWEPCYASEMEAWWMGSPSHRPHILDADFIAVGIGVWAEPSGRCWFEVYFGS